MGRSSTQAMERGPELASRALATLTYRGQKYTKTVVAASALRRSALVYRGQTVNK